MVAYADNYELRWLLRMCFAALVANRVNEWMMYLPAGYRLGQRDSGAVMWMAPCKTLCPVVLPLTDLSLDHALTIIRSFILPRWLGGKITAFIASGELLKHHKNATTNSARRRDEV